jgi:sugar phosphate isomerase/epimerase
MPLETVLQAARDLGFEGVDLWPKPHGNHREQLDEMGLQAFRSLAKKYGVRLVATSRYDLGPFRLTEEIKIVRELGGELIITGCGRGPASTEDSVKAGLGEIFRQLKTTAAVAEEHGVKIAIENHSGTLLATVDSLRWFVEQNPYRSVGIALAPYHLPQDPGVIADLVECLDGQLFLLYAWQYGKGCMREMPKEEELEQLPGRGPLDFRPIMTALRKINYQGWTEIFMHPFPRGTPMLEDPAAIVEELGRAARYLDQFVHGT